MLAVAGGAAGVVDLELDPFGEGAVVFSDTVEEALGPLDGAQLAQALGRVAAAQPELRQAVREGGPA